jgi:hypothetical protein
MFLCPSQACSARVSWSAGGQLRALNRLHAEALQEWADLFRMAQCCSHKIMPGGAFSIFDLDQRIEASSPLPNLTISSHQEESFMTTFIYQCPRTGDRVQGWFPDNERSPRDAGTYESLTCLACGQVHFVNGKTGSVLDRGPFRICDRKDRSGT